jgi:hypothetical protein
VAGGIGQHQLAGRVPAGSIIMRWVQKGLACLVSGSMLLAAAPNGYAAVPASSPVPPPGPAMPQVVTPTGQPAPAPSDQLDQLVAPIALYPDALVAQILAASVDPIEIVEANRWLQQNPGLHGPELAAAVNRQDWNSSVKALTQFPAVLANMDRNLSWTAALGDAESSQPQPVLAAVQVMRQRAQQAGNLRSTTQESVSTQGQTIVIQPADPDIVYVPEYDPWLVYGAPLAAYPYWDPYPGLYLDGPGYGFALGIGIGLFGGFAWGWSHWGADWHGGRLLHDHDAYAAHRPGFHGGFGHGYSGLGHGYSGFDHAGGFGGDAPHAPFAFHSDGLGGFGHAGPAFASPGRFGFGGGMHAGGFGGGMHAGGLGGGFHGGMHAGGLGGGFHGGMHAGGFGGGFHGGGGHR